MRHSADARTCAASLAKTIDVMEVLSGGSLARAIEPAILSARVRLLAAKIALQAVKKVRLCRRSTVCWMSPHATCERRARTPQLSALSASSRGARPSVPSKYRWLRGLATNIICSSGDLRPDSKSYSFQACSIDYSDISAFRINNLRSLSDPDSADCDKSSNVPRSLTGFSSIAAPLLLVRRNDEADSEKLVLSRNQAPTARAALRPEPTNDTKAAKP
jgi:hypothetical protein